jgi:adenylate kinase
MSLNVSQILDIEKQLSSRFQFLVVNIDASDEFLIQRVEGRLVCYSCGYVYDTSDLTKKTKTKCDICSSPLQRRQQDTPEVMKAKLEAYRSQMSPLLALYKEQGILMQIPGDRKFDEVYTDVLLTIEHITGLVASKNRSEEIPALPD